MADFTKHVYRCAGCREIRPVTLCEYVEPASDGGGSDLVAHVISALCDDCVVNHWAWQYLGPPIKNLTEPNRKSRAGAPQMED